MKRHPYFMLEPILLDSLRNEGNDWEFGDYLSYNEKRKITVYGYRRGFMKVTVGSGLETRASPDPEMCFIAIAPWRYRLWRELQNAKVRTRESRLIKAIEAQLPPPTPGAIEYDEITKQQEAWHSLKPNA